MIREVVRDFLRESAKGDSMSACLMVIDNGGILNPCEDHLERRQDWKALTTLDPTLTVTGYERAGNVATVTGSHLDPITTMSLSIEIVHTEYGSWKVRRLNGSAIEWKGEYGTR